MLADITIVYYFIDFWIWIIYHVVMKRSEILNIIKKHYSCFTNGCSSSEEENDHANLLLEKLEKAGMLPPLNEQNYHHMDNADREVVNQTKWYFSWESEEDENG